MKGIGLVFAGGGGKGSYEIGVWKYLHEIGIDQYIRVVSGTSVGALNAALFVGSSYEVAEELWLNISQDKILTPKKITTEDIMKWLVANGFHIAMPIMPKFSKAVSGTIMGMERIAQMILSQINSDHIFSRDGIIEMIKDGVDFNKLQISDIPCYTTCIRCQGVAVERFKLNKYSDVDITTLLLASSAIPIIFPSEKFHGRMYCDGGIPVIGDNVPIKPVYETGVENIIVVHLDRETVIDKNKYPDTNIVEIITREDLGSTLTGTLDFSEEGASYRLNLGYEDAKKILQPIVDIVIMNAVNSKILKETQSKNKEFENRRYSLLKQDVKIKEKMKNDGFDSIFDELTKEN